MSQLIKVAVEVSAKTSRDVHPALQITRHLHRHERTRAGIAQPSHRNVRCSHIDSATARCGLHVVFAHLRGQNQRQPSRAKQSASQTPFRFQQYIHRLLTLFNWLLLLLLLLLLLRALRCSSWVIRFIINHHHLLLLQLFSQSRLILRILPIRQPVPAGD